MHDGLTTPGGPSPQALGASETKGRQARLPPMAVLVVVGGSLARIHLRRLDKKAIFLMILAKLIILPAAGLWLILKLNLPILVGLLLLIQLAMPPATSLSLIVRHYRKEDLLVSQGIFFGHIASIITIPIFLSLYFALVMVR